jgi:hypothetical protein
MNASPARERPTTRDSRYDTFDRRGRESRYNNSRYDDIEEEERRYRRRRRPSPSYEARESMRDQRPRRREGGFRRRERRNGRYDEDEVSDDDIAAESRQDLYVHWYIENSISNPNFILCVCVCFSLLPFAWELEQNLPDIFYIMMQSETEADKNEEAKCGVYMGKYSKSAPRGACFRL